MAGIRDGDLLYEINESGERVLVRSMESVQRAYLRFTNRTTRPIDVWWRDFNGRKRHYVRLNANQYFDINTYITHPWEFTDVTTKERYVINNQFIYRAPANVGGMMYRTNWNITISVRTLRKTALLYLAARLTDPAVATSLELPKTLAEELRELIILFHHPPLDLSS